jgi:hypothetical protein
MKGDRQCFLDGTPATLLRHRQTLRRTCGRAPDTAANVLMLSPATDSSVPLGRVRVKTPRHLREPALA